MYRLIVGHGSEISKSKSRPGSSIPPKKTVIFTTNPGDVLTYRAADWWAKSYLQTELGVKAFIEKAKKDKRFTIKEEGQLYADSIIQFYDQGVWTGETILPAMGLKIVGGPTNMVINSPKSPPKKRISTILSENPGKREIIILFACRVVKGVPATEITKSGKKTALRTESQRARLKTIQEINKRKALKRKQSKSPSPTSKTKTKKQKTSPFTTMMKTLKSTFTIGRSK